MLSHGAIEMSVSATCLAPASAGHGVLAWTDEPFGETASAIHFSGSDLTVPERSILFAPRSGIDVSGSNDDDVCIQAIGQGIVKVAGSTSRFGPLGPGCGLPATVVTDIHANLGGNAHTSLGQSGAVEVGTQVHDKVTVSSNNGTALTGTMDFRRFNTGICAAPIGEEQLNVDVPGRPDEPRVRERPSVHVARRRGLLVPGGVQRRREQPRRHEPCEGPIRFVDARITINPPTGTNAVGDAHQLTGHVDVNDGTGFVNAPDGTTITFAVVTGTGQLSAASCNTSSGSGSCSVDLTNTAVGTDTVSASTTVNVSGVSVSRTTNGNAGPGGSGNATKNWVNLRIKLDPLTATNQVGEAHTITATVEQDTGSGFTLVSGATVTFTLLNNTAGATFVAAEHLRDRGSGYLHDPDQLERLRQRGHPGLDHRLGERRVDHPHHRNPGQHRRGRHR